MGNQVKELRKQLKNVVLGLLPEILTKELHEAIYKKLFTDMNARMDLIANNAKETLDRIDKRSLDMQVYATMQKSPLGMRSERV